MPSGKQCQENIARYNGFIRRRLVSSVSAAVILSGCLSLRTSDKDVKRVLEAYAAEDKAIEQQKSAAADAGIHTLSVAPANGTFNVTADLDHARLDSVSHECLQELARD